MASNKWAEDESEPMGIHGDIYEEEHIITSLKKLDSPRSW
jgi:hypothetical protein